LPRRSKIDSLSGSSHLDAISVVLVAPRNPLNIGAAARAMANFGFSRLTVVAPFEPHWREARSAVGAADLLKDARRTQCLAEAVADCTLVLGTGALNRRKPEQPVVALPALAPLVRHELDRGGRVALVFGPEKRGLTRSDLALCHFLVEIPTHPRQPSMNLGQAVAVCLYELATRPPSSAKNPGAPEPALSLSKGLDSETWDSNSSANPPASSADLDRLAEVIDAVMLAAHYSPPPMRQANRHDLRLLLRRLALSQADVRRALGFFRRVLKRLGP
jgi:TrmH family RNA methyltransferase